MPSSRAPGPRVEGVRSDDSEALDARCRAIRSIPLSVVYVREWRLENAMGHRAVDASPLAWRPTSCPLSSGFFAAQEASRAYASRASPMTSLHVRSPVGSDCEWSSGIVRGGVSRSPIASPPGPRRMCAPSSRCEYLPDATTQPMRARQSAAWATVWRNGGCVRRAGRRPRVERSEQGKGGAGRDEAPAAPGKRLEPIVPRPSSRAPSIRLVVFPVLVPRLGRPARR